MLNRLKQRIMLINSYNRHYSEYGLNMFSRKISKKGTYINPKIDTDKYLNYVRNNVLRSSAYFKKYIQSAY